MGSIYAANFSLPCPVTMGLAFPVFLNTKMEKDDAAVGIWIVNKLQLHNFLTLEGMIVDKLFVPVSLPPGHGMRTTRANLLLLYYRFVPLGSCWHISHPQRSVCD